MDTTSQWRRCSACKKPIEFRSTYWVCNVSTCNRKRTGLAFCSVSCWEVHLPLAHHRQSWAVEKTAPSASEPEPESGKPARREGVRRPIARSATPRERQAEAPTEVLIVASRLKEYIRAQAGFGTSNRVLDPLSDMVRRVCDKAIQNAAREGRRTVLDRDIPRQ